MHEYDGQKLLLIVVIYFSINKYEDAVDQCDSLTDILTSSVTDRPLIICGFLPHRLSLCRGSCLQSVMGYFSMATKSVFTTELNDGIMHYTSVFQQRF